MWDYDKLFAEGNIVGLKNEVESRFCAYQITKDKELPREARYYNFGKRWDDFKNANLARSVIFIQYIIRLDEHGNVAEKLFDRERDIMPKLETGMFVRVRSGFGNTLGYVDMSQDRIVFQDGSWDRPSNIPYWKSTKLLEVYPSGLNCFDSCLPKRAIWKNKKYN